MCAWLADVGCEWAQGWHFSAAVPGSILPQVLTRMADTAVALPSRRAAAV